MTEFPVTTTRTRKRVGGRKLPRHFKHKTLSSFYRNLSSEPREKVEEEEDPTPGLLTSLRVQLINAALSDDKLKAKANKIPIYHPRKKVDKSSLRELYQSNSVKLPSFKEEHRRKLETELQGVLKMQLIRVETDLQRKAVRETEIQEDLEEELSRSLRQQFSSVLESLQATSRKVRVLERMEKMTKKEIKESLEAQLRNLYG